MPWTEKLVRLLARRQLYIERAAVLKRERGAVRDEARIEDVVAKVLAAAKSSGLSGGHRRAGLAHPDRSNRSGMNSKRSTKSDV